MHLFIATIPIFGNYIQGCNITPSHVDQFKLYHIFIISNYQASHLHSQNVIILFTLKKCPHVMGDEMKEKYVQILELAVKSLTNSCRHKSSIP